MVPENIHTQGGGGGGVGGEGEKPKIVNVIEPGMLNFQRNGLVIIKLHRFLIITLCGSRKNTFPGRGGGWEESVKNPKLLMLLNQEC